MSAIAEFDKKWKEWVKWYAYNAPHAAKNPDLTKRLEFLEKAVKGQYMMLGLAADAINEARGTGGYQGLYLPSKLLLNADEIRSR